MKHTGQWLNQSDPCEKQDSKQKLQTYHMEDKDMTGIKKVEKGVYGSYIVTRKGGWGVFINGNMVQWCDTKSGAEWHLQRITKMLNRKQKEV